MYRIMITILLYHNVMLSFTIYHGHRIDAAGLGIDSRAPASAWQTDRQGETWGLICKESYSPDSI